MSRREYQRELDALNEEILTMGSMVEEAVRLSVEALATKDMDLARKVAANDAVVDEIGLAIEGRCLNLWHFSSLWQETCVLWPRLSQSPPIWSAWVTTQ